MTNSDTLKKNMIEALEKTLGVVAPACKMVGISRQTHYRWLKEDEDYSVAVEDVAESTIDFAESQLHLQIKEGSTPATIFYLKTKAKHRGYVERSEVVTKDVNQFEVEVVSDGDYKEADKDE